MVEPNVDHVEEAMNRRRVLQSLALAPLEHAADNATRNITVRDLEIFPVHVNARGNWILTRWFKKLQKWRTGCEGRISVLKRRHGLRRSLYKGSDGIRRWVGLGVIADNVIHIGTHLAEQARSR